MRTKGAKNGKIGNDITKEQFERLASIMCTSDEIASVFGVSYDTLNKWAKKEYNVDGVGQAIKQFNNVGKASLRRTQFKLAEKNANMAIFLGKQYLGQTDKAEQTNVERVAILSDMPEEDEEE